MPYFLDELGIINIGEKKDIYEFTKKFVSKKLSQLVLVKLKIFKR